LFQSGKQENLFPALEAALGSKKSNKKRGTVAVRRGEAVGK
jgi:hypothetical protein